ncbi:MAG: aryl-sulfate sulfotransferase [Bacteroidota bacterium]|nr:aryl-sulfate sulfotransferase [Bacteroidota bacterium]
MFRYKEVEGAFLYKLYINSFDSLKAEIPSANFVYNDSNTCTLVKNLEFGKKYVWNTEAYSQAGQKISTSESYSFSLLKNDFNDPTIFSVSQYINKPAKYRDGIIWLDKYFCALDRSGKVVWQFPKSVKNAFIPDNMVDLHMYNNGNISFSNDTSLYYFNRDLKLIWHCHVSMLSPILKVNNFHHVFNRLPNGNFIALGATTEKFKLDKNDKATYTYDNSIILEFDSLGKLLWHWEFSKNFDTLIIKDVLKKYGTKNAKLSVMVHCNSVAYDSTYKHLYLGCRDFDRIIKIDKASKKIVAQYGPKLTNSDTKVFQTNLFSRQHDVKPIGKNEVLLFNNGEETEKGKSTVMRILLPQNAKETFKKTWELDLDIDTIPGKAIKYGSAELLSNGNYLICGGTNGRILEVTANKEPVWDLYLKAKTLAVFPFQLFAQYRAYYSSSLYPYYFAISINKSNPKSIKLFNEGTDSDSYLLEFFDVPSDTISKSLHTLTTPIIKAGCSYVVQSKIDTIKSIKVTSLSSGIIQWYTINK